MIRVRWLTKDDMAAIRGVYHPSDTISYAEWLVLNHHDNRDRIDATGEVVFCDQGPSFIWECPGCGGQFHGNWGDSPVSGWDAPRWTKEGKADHVTMKPSLGCPNWNAGKCIGHWWVNDGELVLA